MTKTTSRAALLTELNDPVYSLEEVERLTGLSRYTLKREAKRGNLKILKLSLRRFGIRQSEFRRFIDSRASIGNETDDARNRDHASRSARAQWRRMAASHGEEDERHAIITTGPDGQPTNLLAAEPDDAA